MSDAAQPTECLVCRRVFHFLSSSVPICGECWNTPPGHKARTDWELRFCPKKGGLEKVNGTPCPVTRMAEDDRSREHRFAEIDAERLCALWQKRLRLQDWDVSVRILPHWKIKPETEGCCDHTLTRKKALIDILDPDHLYPSDQWPNDMEQTLVHELLHLHFAPFEAETGSPADIAQEQAIDLISDALIALARGSA